MPEILSTQDELQTSTTLTLCEIPLIELVK